MGVCTKQLCKIGHGGKCRVMFIGCCKMTMSHLRLGFNEITYIDISFFWMMSTDPEIVDCRDWMFLAYRVTVWESMLGDWVKMEVEWAQSYVVEVRLSSRSIS